MEPTNRPRRSDSSDPSEQLRALDQVQSATRLDPLLNFGPVWYAPALAALAAGAVAPLSGGIAVGRGWVVALVLVLAVGLLFVVERTPRVRVRPSERGFVTKLIVIACGLVLLEVWTAVQSALGLTGWAAVAELVIGWLIVTGILLMARAWMQRRRAQLWGHG